jgi:carboxymethylenebutenolidase
MRHRDSGLWSVEPGTGQPPTDAVAVSRREFMVTALAGGFALATQPVSAQTIHTDASGLLAGPVSVPSAQGPIPAYRAAPSRAGRHPVIVVVEEIFGVHEHIQDVCRRLAHQGYYAIAPELLARQGDVRALADVAEILDKVISKVPDAQVMADIDATLAFAGDAREADASRVGIVGFCWGGRIVWLYADHNPTVKAGAAFYGGLQQASKTALKPRDPLDLAETLRVPVLGLYAGGDTGIKASVVEQMQQGLEKSASGSQIVVFPGASHGFHADYRPSYDRAAATYAWKLTSEWFHDHGV